jgi:hypothetical protein
MYSLMHALALGSHRKPGIGPGHERVVSSLPGGVGGWWGQVVERRRGRRHVDGPISAESTHTTCISLVFVWFFVAMQCRLPVMRTYIYYMQARA